MMMYSPSTCAQIMTSSSCTVLNRELNRGIFNIRFYKFNRKSHRRGAKHGRWGVAESQPISEFEYLLSSKVNSPRTRRVYYSSLRRCKSSCVAFRYRGERVRNGYFPVIVRTTDSSFSPSRCSNPAIITALILTLVG